MTLWFSVHRAAAGLVMATAVTATAQAPAWMQLTLRDGLPQSVVTTLLEDRDGFLWIGTQNGVARMGAEGIETLRPADPNQGQQVRGLLQDREGRVWASMVDGPLLSILGREVRTWSSAQGLPEGQTRAMALDAGGNLMVAGERGLFRLEQDHFVPIPLPGDWSRTPLPGLGRLTDGLWLSTRQALARWDGHNLETMKLPEGVHDIRAFAAGPDGRGWLLTEDALWCRAQGAWQRTRLTLDRPRFLLLTFGPWGAPVVSMSLRQAWTLDAQGEPRLLGELPSHLLNTTLLDRRGRLWMGTLGQGLWHLGRGGLHRFQSLPSGSPLGSVWSITQAGNRVLFGTDRGISAWEDGRGWIGQWGSDAGLAPVYSLLPGKGSRIWAATQKGLARLDGTRLERVKDLETGIATQVVHWAGGLALATQHGLFLLDAEGRAPRRLALPEDGPVTCLAVMENTLLVGSLHGMLQLEGDQLRPIHENAPFARQRILSLAVDGRGHLWVSSIQGVWRQEGPAWIPVDPAWHRQHGQVYALAMAGDRAVLGHGRGLTVLAPQGVTRLGGPQGIEGEEINSQAMFIDDRARLWVGATDGAYRLDGLQDLAPDHLPPPIAFPGTAPGSQAPAGFAVRIPYPLPPLQPRVECQVEGLPEPFQPLNMPHNLTLRRLPPGSYVLRCRTTLDGLSWVDASPSSFRISPRWHQRMVLRVLAGLTLAGLAVWALRRRDRRLKARNAALAQAVSQATHALTQRNHELEQAHEQARKGLEDRIRQTRSVVHDLRGPLTAIGLVAERLESHVDDAGKRSVALLQKEAGRLEALLRRLLDESRSEHLIPQITLVPLDPDAVLEGLMEGLQVRAAAKGLTFRHETAPRVRPVQIQGDALALQQVLLNLAGNALKFTEKGSVEVHSRLSGDQWILEVRDTGRGMTPQQVAGIFQPFVQAEVGDALKGWGLGLGIVQAMVAAHQGRITVDSMPGLGSAFTVAFPLWQDPDQTLA